MYLFLKGSSICNPIISQKNELEVEKFRSENYLLNVRLNSMSEILALQEADITKVGDGVIKP